jgi:signal transduction histidine kinase
MQQLKDSFKIMVKKLFFILLILLSSHVFCQTKFQVDSLLKAADTETADSNKMKIYNTLANYYMDNNAGSAIEYLEKAKAIAVKLNDKLKEANNFYSIGFCYSVKADYDKSLYNYQQSTFIYEQLKDSFRLANAYSSIGNVYFDYWDTVKANLYYDKAEQLVLLVNDTSQLSGYYNTRGNAYDRMGRYDLALKYLQKGYEIAVAANLQDDAITTLSNIGLTNKHIFNTTKALACFDTVLAYFNKIKAPPDMMGMVYNNIAATYSQAHDYPKALDAFEKSLNYSHIAQSTAIEMENYRNLSDMYGGMKNFEKQSIYLKKYYNLKDSIFTVDNTNQLTELESNYQIEKKNNELAKQESEVVKQKGQRNIFIIITIAIFAVLAILAFFYRRIRNKNKLLKQKNIQISEQKNELQTLNHVKDRLFSIISHDLRNPLITLKSYLMLSENDAISAEKKYLFKVQTMNAVSQTSDMLDNLLAWANVQIKNTRVSIVPLNIEDLFTDCLSNVKAQAFQKKIQIEQDINIEIVPGDYDILSIALRNLLTNAIKYSAENKKIKLSSSIKDDCILIAVKDEGVGLTQEQINLILENKSDTTKGTKGEKGSGLGLFLVKELLHNINATLHIESELGLGSCFTISLPAL